MLDSIRSLMGREVLLCCTPVELPYVERPDYYKNSIDIDRDAAHAADLREREGNPVVLALHKTSVYLEAINVTLGLFVSMDSTIASVAVVVAGKGVTHKALPLSVFKVEDDVKATWFQAAEHEYAVRVTDSRESVEWFIPFSALDGNITQA